MCPILHFQTDATFLQARAFSMVEAKSFASALPMLAFQLEKMLHTRTLLNHTRSETALKTAMQAFNQSLSMEPGMIDKLPGRMMQPSSANINSQYKAGLPLDASMTEDAEPASWSEWNPVTFERVVAQFQTRIYRFIFAMVGEAELAHDLTQDTFLSAFRNLVRRAQADKLEAIEIETITSAPVAPPGHNMSAWLYTIARNAALSELRRRKVVRFLPFLHKPANHSEDQYDFLADTPQLEPGGSLEARTILQDELRLAMDKVGRDKLTALLLHMDGFSYKEICDITGDSLSSIKSQIYRAKESLRRALAANQATGLLNFEEGRQ